MSSLADAGAAQEVLQEAISWVGPVGYGSQHGERHVTAGATFHAFTSSLADV